MSVNARVALPATALLTAIFCSGCSFGPVDSPFDSTQSDMGGKPADTTSILKKLTKDVVIGSTVDPINGDAGPRAISIVPKTYGPLTAGQLLVCNFNDEDGTAGAGTTIELLKPAPSSQPTRFAQSSSIEGCDGDASIDKDAVYGSGLTSGEVVEFSDEGKIVGTYTGSPVADPLSDVSAAQIEKYAPAYIFVGSTTSGSITSISVGFYGTGKALRVAKGFAVQDAGSAQALGPSGLQYDKQIDTLYIADGVTNTIVAFSHASDLLEKDEIVVERGGKTFKCKNPKTTCATLIYSGSPLAAPYAAALLPNGNLIVANTEGTANTLVELTPQGQILDTKVVDSNPTQGVYGLAAIGTNDSNTALFFSDTNSNTLQELEQ